MPLLIGGLIGAAAGGVSVWYLVGVAYYGDPGPTNAGGIVGAFIGGAIGTGIGAVVQALT